MGVSIEHRERMLRHLEGTIMGNNVEKLSGEHSGRVVQRRAEMPPMTSPKVGEVEATVTQWGCTVGDARRFAVKAKRFYLAVRIDRHFDRDEFVSISKDTTKRFLDRYLKHDPMPCEFVHRTGGELWIGTFDAICRAEESDQ